MSNFGGKYHGHVKTSTRCLSVRQATLGHYRSMKRTVIWLTDRQRRELTVLSRRSLVPVSALVRHAVDEFLRRQRKRQRTAALANPSDGFGHF
jgi:Ribbon-helix-helix domain